MASVFSDTIEDLLSPIKGHLDDDQVSEIMINHYKEIFIEIGIEPAINFYGKNTFTDLNAILGLRYQSRTRQCQGLFFQLGYNPILYYSYKSDIDVPFYFGLGLNF